MTPETGLLARIRARRCRFADCERERHPDYPVCPADVNDYYAGRYDERPDRLFDRRRTFTVRVEWPVAA